jgi:uncharacterized repeat protein (TIGR02543 family)
MKKKILSVLVTFTLLFGIFAQLPADRIMRVSAAGSQSVSNSAQLTSAISALEVDTINITSDIVISAELPINRSLTINGNGYTVSVPITGLDDSGVLNASPSPFRVFHITAGTVTISDMTVKGGAAYGTGSGIYNGQSATLYLNRVSISNSGGSSYAGGGIANFGTAYLKNCNISRNAAAFGGGFLNNAGSFNSNVKMFIENCTFSENRSLSESGGGGGGENDASLYVNNSTFSNNISTELGGAINNYNGHAYIVNSTFTGNVNFCSGGGGAIRAGSNFCLANCLFAYNYNATSKDDAYTLNDFDFFDFTPAQANYCVYDGSSLAGTGNMSFNASDYNLFAGGATTTVLAANGTQVGTNKIYQPFLSKISSSSLPTVLLHTGSGAHNAGAKTYFTNGGGIPSVGYYNSSNSTWTGYTGSSFLSDNMVNADQNGTPRAATPSVGAVETTASNLCMLKINSATGGTVDGGTIYGDTYPLGTKVTLTAMPSDGDQFSEWDYVTGGTGTASTSNPYSITVTQDTTLVPKFIASAGYSVTYLGNGNTGGTVPNTATYSSGSNATIADKGSLEKAGNTFAGWNIRANGSGTSYSPNGTYTSSTQNLVLYAQWIALPVTFGGGALTTGTYDSMYNQALTSAAGGSGSYTYVLDSGTLPGGLNLSLGGVISGTPTTFGNYNFSVKAIDSNNRQSPTANFTLEINSLGTTEAPSSSLGSGSVNKGDNITFFTTTPGAAIYYTTNGDAPSAGSTLYTGAITINTDETVKALAVASGYDSSIVSSNTYTVRKYAVTYNVGTVTSGSTPSDYTTYAKGDQMTVKALGSVTKTGYSFTGWTIGSVGNGTVYAAADAIVMGTSSITLYANWTANPYTTSFIVNGGGAVNAITQNYGTAINITPTTFKQGYTFGGWCSDSGLTQSVTFPYTITGSTSLYANWTVNPYTISFAVNGGSAVSDVMKDYGTQLAAPTSTKTGYTLGGWYLDAARTSKVIFPYTISGNASFYASWTVNTYSLNFDSQGGTAQANKRVAYNTTVGTMPTSTKDGYTFGGWFTQARGAGLQYNASTVYTGTAGVTLFAKWSINAGDPDNTPKIVVPSTSSNKNDGEVMLNLSDIYGIGSGNVGVTLGSTTLNIPAAVISGLTSDDLSSTFKLTESPTAQATCSTITSLIPVQNAVVTSINLDLTKIYSDGTAVAIHQLGGKIKITLALSDEQIAKITDVSKARLYYLNTENRTLELIEATFDLSAKTVTFYTDHFSTYVVGTSTPTSSAVSNPKAGDTGSYPYVTVALLAISSAAVIAIRRKRYRRS